MARRVNRFSQQLVIGVVLGIGVVGSLPATVRAEVFLDFYGGAAFTENAEVRGKEKFIPPAGGGPTNTQTFRENADFKDSFTVGGRAGYWIERFPWLGVAIDASYFDADDNKADIHIPVVGLSVLLMMRYPLFTSEQFPKGRLQPYLGIGPELAFTKISAEFKDGNGTTKIKEHATGGGIDIRTGMLWQFYQHWGVFAEYRLTYTQFDTKNSWNLYDEDDIDDDDIPSGGYKREDLDTTLTTHHFLIGISFRF